ncbi:MAG: DUF2490 domain-containing protein [Chitinophagaceae bacterium]
MHHIQSFILSIFLSHFFLYVKAQESALNGWIMLASSVKTNSAFTAYFDGQLRSSDQFAHIQTIMLRPGLNYNIRKNIIATLGYAFIENRRTISGISGYAPEHRVWQQLQLMHPVAFTSLNHRLRLEQRFISKSIVS